MARLLLALLLVLVSLPASAGRRAYVVGTDVPSVPDGDVEIETWLDFLSNRNKQSQWRWWLGPRWSPHETVEVAALLILAQDTGGGNAELWAESLDLRWRPFSHPVAGRLSLDVNARIGIANDLAHQLSSQLGWATRAGRFSFAAQVGYAGGFGGPVGKESYHRIVWSAGSSIDLIKGAVAPPLQLGIEAFGEGVLAGYNDFTGLPGSTVNLGPTLAAAKGRLWLSMGVLFGLTSDSPFAFLRGVIGVAL